MKIDQLKQGIVIRGSIFSEPVKVLTVQIMGNAVKLIGQGINTNQVHLPAREVYSGNSLSVSKKLKLTLTPKIQVKFSMCWVMFFLRIKLRKC